MFKLLATDVDGTLLDTKSKLTELNKKAIKECIAAGIDVVIATGKTIDSIKHIIDELNLNLPQITIGGAAIVNSSGKLVEAIKIPPKLYIDFVRDIRSKGYEPTIVTCNGKIFCKEYSENMKVIIEVGERIEKVDDIETSFFINNVVDVSIPILSSDPMDSYIRNTYGYKLHVVRSGKYFFDILNLDASKGNALKKLIKSLGIKKSEVVSFGDSNNDVSLLEASGLKIAVKNSYPELIKIADVVADANYNSGLGKAIYKYVLNKEVRNSM